MRILLDTCTALWLALDAPDLSRRAKELFEDPANEVYLSTVSAWEISLKYALGKLPLPETPDVLVPKLRRRGRIKSLPLEEPAALHLFRLPPLHGDPFDRMLVAQAIMDGMTIVTPDDGIRRYGISTSW